MAPGRVTVRQQDRVVVLVGGHRHRVARHNVRPVREVGNAAEAFRFALRAEIAARGVKPRESGVALRVDTGLDIERERVWHVPHYKRAVRQQLVFVGGYRDTVERQRDQLQFVAIEAQRRLPVGAIRVAPQAEMRLDPRLALTEVEVEIDRVDEEIGGSIVGKVDRLRRLILCQVGSGVEHWRHPVSRALLVSTLYKRGRTAAIGGESNNEAVYILSLAGELSRAYCPQPQGPA